ncbi:PAS domain-containing protein [Croceicoccus mobilis]|uniref:PAS domain-containing protein n=1 Tax=Croceicoccus mobilis TaxID=1703339 RepID=A0A916Z0K5_9SPHN|nr:PAS domain-containing protein [Croceicoccus mobilis]GGD70071.1 hypothetical protein GCM10010990_19510 [Croceicoccus mobilis]
MSIKQELHPLPPSLAAFMDKSTVAFTVADALLPDFPLVHANPSFTKLTEFSKEAVVGHNCRFLQPEGGGGPVRAQIRKFLDTDAVKDGRFVIPNVTASGRPFLNLLYMSKIERAGKCIYILGSQFDISSRDKEAAERYDEALTKDLSGMRVATGETGHVLTGTFSALASSAAIIARAKLEE